MTRPVVVGIAGGSASGKSTLATALRAALQQEGHRVGVLASDRYMFHDLERGPVFRSPSTGQIAFDCNRPDSIDWPAVLRDLDARLTAPDAPDVLLVDGMMLLYIEEVRERLDLRLFVELDADERAMRRMLRDLRSDRGLDTPEAIAAYYLESARIGHATYIEPSRVHADLIIRGDAPTGRVIPMLLSVVERQLAAEDPQAVLDLLVSTVEDALSPVGIYLYGSLTTGDFDPGISDIDLVVVLDREPDAALLPTLDGIHQKCLREFPEFRERLDIIYVSRDAVSADGTPPAGAQLANTSPGEPLHVQPVLPEWSMNFQQIWAAGRTLAGAPVRTVVPELGADRLADRVALHIRVWPSLLDEKTGRRGWAYALLTFCRALYTLRTGEQIGKKRAAAWAGEQWPELLPALETALDWRAHDPGDAPVPPEFAAQTRKLLDRALDEV